MSPGYTQIRIQMHVKSKFSDTELDELLRKAAEAAMYVDAAAIETSTPLMPYPRRLRPKHT